LKEVSDETTHKLQAMNGPGVIKEDYMEFLQNEKVFGDKIDKEPADVAGLELLGRYQKPNGGEQCMRRHIPRPSAHPVASPPPRALDIPSHPHPDSSWPALPGRASPRPRIDRFRLANAG